MSEKIYTGSHTIEILPYSKIDELKKQNKALLEALPPLIEEASNMKDQYGCDCGHPNCRMCADTKTLAIAIDGAEKAIAGEERW